VIDRILGPQPGEIPAQIRIYIRVNKRFRARHVARLRKAYVAAKFYIVARRIARARHQRSDGGLAVPKMPSQCALAPIDWRSPITAQGKDPVVLVLWVIVADGKLVARSNGPRYSTVQRQIP
jgi:hypothetical protein